MDKQKNYIQLIYRLMVGLLSIGFLYVIWPYISSVLLMLVFAFLFTTVLLSSVDILERKIRNRGLSVLVVTVGLIAAISIFVGSFATNLADQAGGFSQRLETESFMDDFNNFIDKTKAKLPDFAKGGGEDVDAASKLNEVVGNVMSTLLTFAGALGSFIFNMIMVIIFTIILLLNYHQFKKSLVGFIPNKYFEVGLRLIYNIEQQVSNYLRGQLFGGNKCSDYVHYWIIYSKFLWSKFDTCYFYRYHCRLANLIPLVGPFIGMLIAFAVALMNNLGNEAAQAHMLFNAIPSPFYILDVALMFIIVQQVDNNFITPLLVGESVGLHPIMVMIALLIGGTLIGPMGMLFAVPAAGIIKVIGHEYHS